MFHVNLMVNERQQLSRAIPPICKSVTWLSLWVTSILGVPRTTSCRSYPLISLRCMRGSDSVSHSSIRAAHETKRSKWKKQRTGRFRSSPKGLSRQGREEVVLESGGVTDCRKTPLHSKESRRSLLESKLWGESRKEIGTKREVNRGSGVERRG